MNPNVSNLGQGSAVAGKGEEINQKGRKKKQSTSEVSQAIV